MWIVEIRAADRFKPSWYKRWWAIAAAVVVLLAVAAELTGGSDEKAPAASGGAASATTQSDAEREAPTSATGEASASSRTGSPKPSMKPSPGTSPAPPPPAAPTEKHSGTGAEVVILEEGGPRIVEITHRGQSNFAVWTVDSRGQTVDLLVNEIGSHSGTYPLNFLDGEEAAALKIEADGQWSVTSEPVTSAPSWSGAGAYSGKGAEVVLVDDVAEGLTPVKITHQGNSNFAVWAYGDSRDLLVNDIGSYSGETLLPTGAVVLVVEADGPWWIAKS